VGGYHREIIFVVNWKVKTFAALPALLEFGRRKEWAAGAAVNWMS